MKIITKLKTLDKKDLLSCILLIVSFIAFVIIITYPDFYYGSTTDWESQHITIPDYFRTLFYDTHSLFPDLALNLGNGQNIYNFSYYGLLNPIILISYLLPFVSMIDFIIYSTIIACILAAILFYFWLRKNNNSHLISFISSFILLFATSITFHSHRHIMFINYMPFLILGLYGVDKKLTAKKGWLLSLSVFLMVMTSYYYSISGIICLILYGIYKYIKLNKKITFKKFFLDGCSFISPMIIGVLSSAIITLPTFQVILSSRGETYNTITLKDLIIPSINSQYVLYKSYGIGLTAILLLAIINLFYKKRENRYLGIVLSLIILFPIVNFILNATMYIDAKVLIPLLPLAVIAINILIKDLFNKDYSLLKLLIPFAVVSILVIINGQDTSQYLLDVISLTIFLIAYKYFKKEFILIIPLLLTPFVSSIISSKGDPLLSKEGKIASTEKVTNAINEITASDDTFYRISNNLTILRDVNNIYGNIDNYTSTLYSSTYNINYNSFFYDIINNPIQNRNRVITSGTPNLMYLLFSNSKYLISNQEVYHGYELYREINGLKIYKSENTLPFAYAISSILSEDDFDKLRHPYNTEALLKNVVVGTKSNTEFISDVREIELDLANIVLDDLEAAKEDDYYIINVPNENTITYQLPEEYHDKILFIKFDVLESQSCDLDDTSIIINNVKNKLTCAEWKYHNQNYQFDYIIASKDLNELEITFTKGQYKIKDIETYILDYAYIENINKFVDEFIVDKDKTKGDFIIGEIDVKEDGYFVTSLPYDNGYIIKVDGQEIDYTLVNKAFVGFAISSGHHEITIEYQAPLKNLSLGISAFGVLMFGIVTLIESKQKIGR